MGLTGGAEGAAAASVRREKRAALLVSRSPLVDKFRVQCKCLCLYGALITASVVAGSAGGSGRGLVLFLCSVATWCGGPGSVYSGRSMRAACLRRLRVKHRPNLRKPLS